MERKMEQLNDLLVQVADDVDSLLIEATDEDWEGVHDADQCKKIASRLRELADSISDKLGGTVKAKFEIEVEMSDYGHWKEFGPKDAVALACQHFGIVVKDIKEVK